MSSLLSDRLNAGCTCARAGLCWHCQFAADARALESKLDERDREIARLQEIEADAKIRLDDRQQRLDKLQKTATPADHARERIRLLECRLHKYKAALTEIMRGSYAGASFIAQEALLNAEPLVVERQTL